MNKVEAAITIRAAAESDAAALADLSAQLGYPTNTGSIRARLARMREVGADEVFLAENADGRILGWTHVAARLNLEEEPFAELVVDAGARGGGIGKALLHAAEKWAQAHGFARLRVRSNVIRTRAHDFYVREGYVERKRQVVFDKTLGS